MIGIVPAFATAPALIVVGVFMFKNIKSIDFTNFEESVPAFLTIILMPLTYNISTGLTFGFGRGTITVMIADATQKSVDGFLFGPFILID